MTPRCTLRYANMVELVFQNQQDVQSWVVQAANSLDAAFAGATTMFTLGRGTTYRSNTIRRKKWGLTQYENRGLSRVTYDPEDFWAPAGTLPHDADTSYLRVQEVDAAGVTRPAGAILIIPAGGFYSGTKPKLTISGTAPNVAASATGVPPAGSMHFVLPRAADYSAIYNTSAVSIFLSFAPGEAELEVPANSDRAFYNATVSEIFVRGDGATAGFSMYLAVNNGEYA